MTLFKNLGLNDELLRGIEALGFQTPTPVQGLVIPVALHTQGDIIALAQTGTGKTAAFGLPLLQLIDAAVRGVQAMILCPTRELCVQVASDLVNYAQFAQAYKVVAVYGGASIETQIRQIRSGAQIIVATPGRMVDLINRGAVNLDQVTRFILDEADEMLNMGFKDDLDTILAAAVNRKSVWLFSATMSSEVRFIAKSYMDDPEELSVGTRNQTNANIEHQYYVCRPDDRYATLKRVVDANPGIFGLIFCRTKAETKEIAEQMTRDGYNSDALHGDLSQNDRDRVMTRFRENNLQLLIATDVAARGIDVSDITHVINYGLPDDIEVYTHRSGRTGRAGKTGVAITILTPKFEERIFQIERINKAKFEKKSIPSGEEVCESQLMHIVKTIHDTEVNDSDIEPFLPKIYEELQDLSKEDLIKRFASMEFNRFLDYYRDAVDLNVYRGARRTQGAPGERPVGNFRAQSGSFQRVFVNIGEMDGVHKREFLQILTEQLQVPAQTVGQIDIKKSFMHFDIDGSVAEMVKAGLQTLKINGRVLRVDDATPGREKTGSSDSRPRTFQPREHRGSGYGGGGNGGGSRYERPSSYGRGDGERRKRKV